MGTRELRRTKRAVAGAVLLVVGLATQAAGATALPDAMAAIGDSITQAANADGSTIGSSNPEHSWSTGDDSGDGITSHYERILAANPGIDGANHNVSVSGAKMDDAPAQASDAVTRGVEYVTFLMGGNDLCTSSPETMTSVAAFEADLREAMDRLVAGLPAADIYLVSVPDVYQLWDLFKNDRKARSVWRTFNICQSLLSDDNTEQDRQLVRQRNIEFNDVLQNVCAEYGSCLYDGGAVFDYQFTKRDVSSLDYFHPSKEGQANLAEVTWHAGYWAS
jgi:lysophospholipase L1-like esterase